MATIQELSDRLRELQDLGVKGTAAAASGMGLLMVAETTLVELRKYSHGETEPTTSPPGEPPALVSGRLRASMRMTPPVTRGARSGVMVGGTAPYARIQELGGEIYARNAPQLGSPIRGFFGTHVTLPARPYLKPAEERLEAGGKLRSAAAKGFIAVVYGGGGSGG